MSFANLFNQIKANQYKQINHLNLEIMKTKLLSFILVMALLHVNAQTTHNLDWFTGVGSNVDLTIEPGDTVIWTWTSQNHTVENVEGSSVETFDSGFLEPNGSTFSHTFNVVGANAYFCGVHGAASMSGTITVVENLRTKEENTNAFIIESNPVNTKLNIRFPLNIPKGEITIYSLLGKIIILKTIVNKDYISLDVSNLHKGLYLISINSEKGAITQRFIKR